MIVRSDVLHQKKNTNDSFIFSYDSVVASLHPSKKCSFSTAKNVYMRDFMLSGLNSRKAGMVLISDASIIPLCVSMRKTTFPGFRRFPALHILADRVPGQAGHEKTHTPGLGVKGHAGTWGYCQLGGRQRWRDAANKNPHADVGARKLAHNQTTPCGSTPVVKCRSMQRATRRSHTGN